MGFVELVIVFFYFCIFLNKLSKYLFIRWTRLFKSLCNVAPVWGRYGFSRCYTHTHAARWRQSYPSHTDMVYSYIFVWKFRTIAQHYYYWIYPSYHHHTYTWSLPSPSGRDGVRTCISIFRKHFRLAYDSLGNWKTPDDEHNQDESTLYISDPLEGAIYWNQQFLDCVHGGQSFTPQKSRSSREIQIGDGNDDAGTTTVCFDEELKYGGEKNTIYIL